MDSAASASSSASSSGAVVGVVGHQQRFGVGRLVVDRMPMSLSMRDDALDLLGVEHVVGQVVVDLGVREVAALLAQHDQVLQARAARLGVVGQRLELLRSICLPFGSFAMATLFRVRIDEKTANYTSDSAVFARQNGLAQSIHWGAQGGARCRRRNASFLSCVAQLA